MKNKKINAEREKRYEEKINYARERIANLEEWLYEEDTKERKTFFASEKVFQEVVESIADIFAMILSDLDLSVNDDYSNINKLKEKKILSGQDANILIEANGLRNRIVHRYNNVDEKRFIESSKELLPKLVKVLEHIETFIQKKLKNE